MVILIRCLKSALSVLIPVILSVQVAVAMEFSTLPKSSIAAKCRIGYYEGGGYSNYYKCLSATIKGLMDIGWIQKEQIPKRAEENSKMLWSWLATNAKSKYLIFIEDAFYSANWDNSTRKHISKAINDRLAIRNDLDIMIAMGTWAGVDLANDQHRTNTIVMSTSDPLRAGIISRIDDSGRDHVHAMVDPSRIERQVETFYELVGFNKLGIAYEDSVAGRYNASIDRIKNVADQRGFEIERCYTASDIGDPVLAGESVKNCFKRLIDKGVEAIYVTVQGGVNAETLPILATIANEKQIPTFSQLGPKEVKHGFLMSISEVGKFKTAGRYFAMTLAQIFNGASPRQLNQVFEGNQKIAINLKAAQLIGFDFQTDIFAATDEIYNTIEPFVSD